jgi:hypothetical protein
MSLPYFRDFGWKPVVLAVEAGFVEGVEEPLLLKTIPADIPIERVRALPVGLTRKIGVGNAGLRAFPFLKRAGSRMIQKHDVDLIYFSTTMFSVMTLGRIWKTKFGVPYVLDMQDPWVRDYYDGKPKAARALKHKLARAMHKTLEPWTMRRVDGIIAVSESYHETLRNRYPWIAPGLCDTIPFGASGLDFDIVGRSPQNDTNFKGDNGLLHGVYAGVLGKAMERTCAAICLALREGLEHNPSLFSRVRLHFVGTDYANGGRGRQTIKPIAEEMGLGEFVKEEPRRVPYLQALQMLKEADFLLAPGSVDPQYTASKIYPYILANKPLLAIYHESSSVVQVLRSTQSGDLVTFSTNSSAMTIASSLLPQWTDLLSRLPYTPSTNFEAFQQYTAREMTRQQCELFDRVIQFCLRKGSDAA